MATVRFFDESGESLGEIRIARYQELQSTLIEQCSALGWNIEFDLLLPKHISNKEKKSWIMSEWLFRLNREITLGNPVRVLEVECNTHEEVYEECIRLEHAEFSIELREVDDILAIKRREMIH